MCSKFAKHTSFSICTIECIFCLADGVLMKFTKGKNTKGKNTERHVFLFDALIVLCKQNLRRTSTSTPQGEYKLKEKFNIRQIEVRDKVDNDGWYPFLRLQHLLPYVQYCL